MHTNSVIATLSLFSQTILAHGHGHEFPIPRVFGQRSVRHVGRAAQPEPAPVPAPVLFPALESRQSADPDTCGPGIGSCAANKCCSPAGYCGTSEAYCAAPDCQINYGPACDSNLSPPGTLTSTIARTKVGSVLYGGAGIYSCTVPGTVAITYDDGPYIYTSKVLDLFDAYNAKATFFVTGNNLGKGPIDNPAYPWRSIIQRMDSSGHQIASHTWAHQDLSAISATQLQDAIYKLEMALRNILGKFPTYMRPPYSSCNAACQAFLATAGYHITYFDQDTSDYLFATPSGIQVSKDYITTNLTKKGDPTVNDWLTVAHDIQDQTANNLTEFMLKSYTAKGFKLVTVGECLGDPVANWYRTAGGAGTYNTTTSASSASAKSTGSATGSAVSVASSALPSPTGISLDATCGTQGGGTCLGSTFGNCCSAAGWCGATSDYCGTGCQVGYGSCGSNVVSSVVAIASSASNISVVASGASAAASASTSTSPGGPGPSLTLSLDGSCGLLKNYTCQGYAAGNCCSQYGWCGNTDGHCGTGCQVGFGTCGIASSAISLSALASSAVNASSARAVSSSQASSAQASSIQLSSAQLSSIQASSVQSPSIQVSSIRVSSVQSPSVQVSSVRVSSVQSPSVQVSSVQSSSVQVSSVQASLVKSSSANASSSASSSVKLSLAASSSAKSSSAASSSAISSLAKSSSVVSSSITSSAQYSSSIVPSSSFTSSNSTRSSSVSSSRSSLASALPISTLGQCGLGAKNQTCTGSIFGTCCLAFGSTTGVCYSGIICTLLKTYCLSEYGTC